MEGQNNPAIPSSTLFWSSIMVGLFKICQVKNIPTWCDCIFMGNKYNLYHCHNYDGLACVSNYSLKSFSFEKV